MALGDLTLALLFVVVALRSNASSSSAICANPAPRRCQ